MNKIAVVTGGTRGIGKAITEKLVKEGVFVVVAAQNEALGKSIVSEINTTKELSEFIQTDISDYNSVEKLFKKVVEKYKKIDILINNAAISGTVGLLHTLSTEEFERTIKTNLFGTFYCCKEVLPIMIQQNYGRIVNFASKGGLSSHPFTGSYNASKAGILNLTKTLSAENAKYNITINCIMPGLIWTDMAKDGIEKIGNLIGKSAEEIKQENINKSPFKRLTTEKEVADVVAFIVSEEASSITGDLIDLSGGGL